MYDRVLQELGTKLAALIDARVDERVESRIKELERRTELIITVLDTDSSVELPKVQHPTKEEKLRGLPPMEANRNDWARYAIHMESKLRRMNVLVEYPEPRPTMLS